MRGKGARGAHGWSVFTPLLSTPALMPSTRFTSPPFAGTSAAGLFLLCFSTAAAAQTRANGLWHGNLSIGGSSSSGTTSATSLNLRAESSKVTDADKISLNALVNYGRSKAHGVTTRSAELARAGGRHDRNLDERFFAFGGAEGEVNRPDGVSSRLSVNVGAGWHALRGETTSWDVFTGLGHTETKFADSSSRRGAEALRAKSPHISWAPPAPSSSAWCCTPASTPSVSGRLSTPAWRLPSWAVGHSTPASAFAMPARWRPNRSKPSGC
jgi:hypothetical protein